LVSSSTFVHSYPATSRSAPRRKRGGENRRDFMAKRGRKKKARNRFQQADRRPFNPCSLTPLSIGGKKKKREKEKRKRDVKERRGKR